jgi:hypothetical protein
LFWIDQTPTFRAEKDFSFLIVLLYERTAIGTKESFHLPSFWFDLASIFGEAESARNAEQAFRFSSGKDPVF